MMSVHLNTQLYGWSALPYFTNNAQLVFIDSQLAPIYFIIFRNSVIIYGIIHQIVFAFFYLYFSFTIYKN